MNKQIKKDLKAQLRISEMFRDKKRVQRLKDFISQNPEAVREIKISIKIKEGGK